MILPTCSPELQKPIRKTFPQDTAKAITQRRSTGTVKAGGKIITGARCRVRRARNAIKSASWRSSWRTRRTPHLAKIFGEYDGSIQILPEKYDVEFFNKKRDNWVYSSLFVAAAGAPPDSFGKVLRETQNRQGKTAYVIEVS
ncbi:hypothetical protein RUND412_009970 [Rhizina undulata]